MNKKIPKDLFDLRKFEKICFSCGSEEDVTIHHIRDCVKKNKRKNYSLRGIIYLCESCHKAIEYPAKKRRMKIILEKEIKENE